MAPPHLNKTEQKQTKRGKRKERQKEKKRAQPSFTDQEGVQRAVNKIANQRRRALRRILASKDKMGLTNVGLEQLKNFLGKNTEPAKRPAMDGLEQSAAKVLDSLSAEGFNELLAWSDARNLGQGPKKETVLEHSMCKQEGRAIKEEGEDVKDLEESDDNDDNDGDEEEEEEEEKEERGLMTPVPVSP